MKKVDNIFLFILISLMLITTGCNNQKNDVKNDLNNSSPIYGIKTTLPIVSIHEIWDKVNIISKNEILPDSRRYSPMGISEDGIIIANVPAQNSKPYQIILYDILNEKFEVVADLYGESQPGYTSINSKWFVWTELLDQSFINYKIHVFNRVSHEDKVVFTNPKDSKGNPYSGPEPIPSVYENEFVWSAVTGNMSSAGLPIVIKKYNLITNSISNVMNQAANPIKKGNFLVWLEPDDKTNKSNASAIFWNKNGKTEQITKGKSIIYFDTDGSSVAWSGHNTIDSDEWTVGLITNSKQKILLSTVAENAPQFVTIGSRIVAWTEYDKVQVYDRKYDKIVTLEDKDGSYSRVFTNNRFLYWTTPVIEDIQERDKDGRSHGIYLNKIHLIDLKKLN